MKSQIISRTSRSFFLKKVNSEVDSRLNTSLYKQIFIVLDKNKNPGQIEKFGEMIYKVDDEFKSRLKHKEITTVFDQTDVNGRLLILGEPGSGKTTILLKLAKELVERAQYDENHPIPVLFSLSSWKKYSQSIQDWLVEQLREKYGVRKDIGKKLTDNQKIIPLLDGLDEIAAERQELCIRKINDFLHSETWSNPLVVCSRTEQYQYHEILLQLNNSIELCPFTPQQVYQYLNNTGNRKLWDTISHDFHLSQLATIPLLLNIIALSIEEISVETWQQYPENERLSYLLEAYIRRMLRESYQYNGKRPKHQQTRNWLGWLAHQLVEENQTEFFIEKIQPSYLKTKFQRFIYKTVILAIVLMLFFWLFPIAIIWLPFWVFIWFFSNTHQNIIIIESLKFNAKHYSYFLTTLLISILGFGFFMLFFLLSSAYFFKVVLGLNYEINYILISLLIFCLTVLIIGLIIGLIVPIGVVEIENKNFPNQGIYYGIVNTLLIPFLICVPIALLIFSSFLIFFTTIDIYSALVTSLVLGLFPGLLIGITTSGIPVIQHFILRTILWFSGYIPWNYAKFLNYCTNRLLLQRVGGGYRFIHKMLQDHFAQMEFERRNLQRNN